MIPKFNKYSISILAISIISIVLLSSVQNVWSFLSGACLFVEDGNVFINQAFEMGVKSVWIPYNGYLHIFPRIFALIASIFDLSYTPFIFILGWYIAYFYMAITAADFLYSKNTDTYLVLLVLIAIGLQPHSGETYFNITNAQWFLAIVLIIRTLNDRYLRPSIVNFLSLLLIGLTGPFSVFIIPLILLKILLKKDIKENWFGYLIVLMTASAQIFFMLNSSRLKGGLDKPITVWLKSFYTYFTFGGHGIVVILSLFFWVIFLYFILKSIRSKPELSDVFFTDGILILFAAALFYFPGLIVKKSDPSVIITPLSNGSRYFIVPYALSVFSIPILIRQKKMVLILLLNFLLISGLQFPEYTNFMKIRSDLNYQSYAWLSSRIENLIIPIAPQWGKFPGWHIRTLKPTTNNPYRKKINVKAIRKYGVSSFTEDKFLNLNDDSYFIIKIPYECIDSKHIGVEVDVVKKNGSWAKIFWKKRGEDYNNFKSYERYYPIGTMKMQFAFKNKGYSELKFKPIRRSGALKINAFDFICEN
jgi:hypothetical protein